MSSLRRIYRIVHPDWADQVEAFNGRGAAKYPGRWNLEGTPCVYCGETLSLCLLEQVVHLDEFAPDAFKGFEVQIPESCISQLDKTPTKQAANSGEMAEFGDRWLKSGASLALRVPSVVNPYESNFLLNPLHKDFKRLAISGPFHVPLDGRLR